MATFSTSAWPSPFTVRDHTLLATLVETRQSHCNMMSIFFSMKRILLSLTESILMLKMYTSDRTGHHTLACSNFLLENMAN